MKYILALIVFSVASCESSDEDSVYFKNFLDSADIDPTGHDTYLIIPSWGCLPCIDQCLDKLYKMEREIDWDKVMIITDRDLLIDDARVEHVGKDLYNYSFPLGNCTIINKTKNKFTFNTSRLENVDSLLHTLKARR